MAVMSLRSDSHRLRQVSDWTAADVREFLESILPGHPCVDCFTYTSGYVLDSLEKDDLRRQARDEEAANVIWAQLKHIRAQAPGGGGAAAAGSPIAGRSAAASASGARPSPPATANGGGGGVARDLGSSATFGASAQGLDASQQGRELITVYVKTREGVALEFEVDPGSCVGALKELIDEREGMPREAQRLVCQGVSMQDDRPLQSYLVRNGSHLLLVPQLRELHHSGGTQALRTFAPRGPLMVPGSSAWHPKSACHRPYLPVLCRDISRPFPVSLEFPSASALEAFTMAARQGTDAPVLEIKPTRTEAPPFQSVVTLDSATGGVVLDVGGDFLAPSTEYEAIVHFGGRGGHIEVTVQTGADMAATR